MRGLLLQYAWPRNLWCVPFADQGSFLMQAEGLKTQSCVGQLELTLKSKTEELDRAVAKQELAEAKLERAQAENVSLP